MNEKRFVGKLLTNSNGEEFGFTIYDNEKRLNINDVVGLLNDQQDTITELEKNFEDLVNWSSEISKRNVLLDEKIGRLQQENKKLKNKLNNDL